MFGNWLLRITTPVLAFSNARLIKNLTVHPGHGVVARYKQARLDEIEAAYRRSFDRFLHVATAITGNVESAADCVQDAFSRAIRLRRGYRGTGSIEAWLWRIVVNVARDRASETREFASSEIDQAAGEILASDSAQLRSMLADLPERQRLVLFLRYYADLDYQAIATALEISSGTVGATLHSAHAAIRTQIQEAPCS
jgi:RNA polymerase sigma-70 factor, ECF subfamily